MDFSSLILTIKQMHLHLAERASRAVNTSLTVRNWLIGFYIFEYEQNGLDRAEYGDGLFKNLSDKLSNSRIVSYHPRELRRCRDFYMAYPEIRGTLSPKFIEDLPESAKNQPVLLLEKLPDSAIRETASPEFGLPPQELMSNLSFSHFVELIPIDDKLKRAFYEEECIRGTWSIRELKRQIGSSYYERSCLSMDKAKLRKLVNSRAHHAEVGLNVRDPYVFEFLGIKPKEVMSESDLEDALLDKLQDFLLELGHGFCFEARQKRILIGDTYGFVDLVFYHRILKCHVLIDLKVERFSHENIGQLNTYVSWYRKNMMQEEDNNPIGILLCAKKDNALIEYALAGMDNNLFVSRYQLELPSKEEMKRFLEESISNSEGNY